MSISQQIKTNDKFIAAARAARTVWRAGSVVVPAVAAAYLFIKFNDLVVTGLSVLLGLYAASQFIKSMWLAELNAAGDNK